MSNYVIEEKSYSFTKQCIILMFHTSESSALKRDEAES